jgi:hypothetical protein
LLHVGAVTTLGGFQLLGAVDAIVGAVALTTDDLARDATLQLSSTVQVVTGSFALGDTADSPNPLRLHFGALREVGGDFTLGSLFDLTSLRDTDGINDEEGTDDCFPLLAAVGGSLTISDHVELENVALPTLARIGGSLTVRRNPDLTAITLPGLGSVGAAFTVTENQSLRTLDVGPVLDLRGVALGRDFTVEFNGPDLTCDEIDAVFDSLAVCPTADDFIASQGAVPCGLTCP